VRPGLYVPLDELTGGLRSADVGADFLELAAFFATDGFVWTSDIANEVSVGADEEASTLDNEMKEGVEEMVSMVVQRIEGRRDVLGSAYPFRLDPDGDILSFEDAEVSLGRSAYVLSLVLSNLQTPVLNGSPLRPGEEEIRQLRQLFQYLSTAALAAEVQGVAWSFGFPRPDGSSFLGKLREIWATFDDGRVRRRPSAPDSPKDDSVDVFAARLHPDRLAGFLFAAAQVATGMDWTDKSLLAHLGAFRDRWFANGSPATQFIPYMIVPFALDDRKFRDHVIRLGNVLHRLRVPRRVSEAQLLVDAGVEIEAYDRLQEVVDWVVDYRNRAREAA